MCLYTPDAREKLRHPGGFFRKGQGIRLYNYRNSIGIIRNEGKDKMKLKTEEQGMRLWILIAFCMLPFFYGMYYEFCGAITTVVLGMILLAGMRRKKNIQCQGTVGFSLALLLLISYLITCIWAVDSGMAFLGIFRISWIVLLLLFVQQTDSGYRDKLFSAIPYVGAVMCLIGFIGFFVPFMKEHLYSNGRLGGFFQYPNTFALFLLIGIVLLCNKKHPSLCDYVLAAVLTTGIGVTGSRTVLVLTVLVFLFIIVRNRNGRLAAGAVVFAAAFAGVVWLTGDSGSVGRITTFSLTDSTLVGRLLYVRDALPLLLKHPFGMGYLGYYYMENEIQTGVYTVRYIHNDLMQLGLDIGWIPMGLYLFAVGKTLLCRKVSVTNKLVTAVIFIHSLLDFDYSYTVILAIILLIMEDVRWKQAPASKSRKQKDWNFLSGKPLTVKRGYILAQSGILMLFSAYMTVPLLAAYTEQPALAVTWYPWYTEEQLKLLSESEDVEEVDSLADRILSQNSTCALAYQAKAMAAYCRDDYEGVMKWQKEAIARDYFRYEVYLDYAYMLYDGMLCMEKENPVLSGKCREELGRIPEYLSEAEGKISRLGSMIDDQPQLSVDEAMEELLEE